MVRVKLWGSLRSLAGDREVLEVEARTLKEAIDAILTRLEQKYGHAEGSTGLILVSTETPTGVLNLPTFTDCQRVIALSWGAEDLSAALGAVVGFALGFMLVRWHAWHHRNDRALQPTLLDVVEPPPAQAVNLV